MMKKVYICSPLGGNVEENLRKATLYTRYALKCGVAPITVHYYALALNDNNPKERKEGQAAGISLLWYCDELWIFGDEITEGMKEEISFCKNMRIKTRKISDGEIKKVLGGNKNDKKEILAKGNTDNGDTAHNRAVDELYESTADIRLG